MVAYSHKKKPRKPASLKRDKLEKITKIAPPSPPPKVQHASPSSKSQLSVMDQLRQKSKKSGKPLWELLPTVDHTGHNHVVKKLTKPAKLREEIVPEYLSTNTFTGTIDVATDFFWKVYDEYGNDNTWNAWVCYCKETGIVMGVLVLQMFVHESTYFRWGPPLQKTSMPADPETGIIPNIAEVSLLCSKGCGKLLLQECYNWVVRSSKYEALVVSSTLGAVEYYKKRGFKPVKAYRLSKSKGKTSTEHLYRHRIPDKALTETDYPSIMLYLDVKR